ncbi:MAG: recombination mediator RecR [Verrucomicrobia bacterium]|nr:recombination mediator RecR [Verrucomicrobiota bacterium]MCF7708908.1 recombination mediator RecR [Verrucomicrobiota bacterium]
MNTLPEPVRNLIIELGKLPGIGPRSAERLALHIVQTDAANAEALAKAVTAARERIQTCKECGALTENQPCEICRSPRRDRSIICVVERAVDILSIEKSSAFSGVYHVLGGKISPLSGIGPEDLKISELDRRIAAGDHVKELILALGTDVEGEATGFFLAKRYTAKGVAVTRLAYGLPVGGALEFADQLTLSRAIEGRRQVE